MSELRERIGQMAYEHSHAYGDWPLLLPSVREWWRELADRILALREDEPAEAEGDTLASDLIDAQGYVEDEEARRLKRWLMLKTARLDLLCLTLLGVLVRRLKR